MKSGITRVSASLLCVFVAATAAVRAPHLDVPRGFTASVYVRGIVGARDLDLAADGTLTVHGRSRTDRFEIAPPTADAPLTVMRVAAELAGPPAPETATLAVQAPRFVYLRWNAASGELGYSVAADGGERIPVAPQTLALARTLSHRRADVVLAPDGTLFVADSRAGAVWQVRRTPL